MIFCEVAGRRLNRGRELRIEVPGVYKFYERQSHLTNTDRIIQFSCLHKNVPGGMTE